MANSPKFLYITSPYRGYLAVIKSYGPIVHPIKVTEEAAAALHLAGAPIFVHDLVKKTSRPYNLTDKGTITPADPISVTPVSSGNFKIEPVVAEKPVIPTPPPMVQSVANVPTTDEVVGAVVQAEETEPPVIPLDDILLGIKVGTLTEDDIDLEKYSKTERKKIRTALKAATKTEE